MCGRWPPPWPSEIEPLIRPVGFYRTKSRAIRECSRELLERFGGEVPRTIPELETLPSVGPKTANCVLVFGYGIPGIPVDTHVHRIANRLGIVPDADARGNRGRIARGGRPALLDPAQSAPRAARAEPLPPSQPTVRRLPDRPALPHRESSARGPLSTEARGPTETVRGSENSATSVNACTAATASHATE